MTWTINGKNYVCQKYGNSAECVVSIAAGMTCNWTDIDGITYTNTNIGTPDIVWSIVQGFVASITMTNPSRPTILNPKDALILANNGEPNATDVSDLINHIEGTTDQWCYTPGTGACCNGINCSITTQANCVSPNVYKGDGTTCSPNPCLGTEVVCWRCDGTTPTSHTFPVGTTCGPNSNYGGYNYPYSTQPNCGGGGCLSSMCVQTTPNKTACEGIIDPSDPTKHCCYWYSDIPFMPATCHSKPEDPMTKYLIYGGIALVGLAAIVLLLKRRG